MTHKQWPPIPILYPEEALASIFGCVEMELAALEIMRDIIREQDWESLQDCRDFNHDDYVLAGFTMLVGYGWLKPSDPNGTFIVTKSFAKRVTERLPIPAERRHLA